MAKKVAVIGAGASGLPAIKCCVDEGLQPVCFERTDHIGGLWYYTDEPTDGQASVMKSTVMNTSNDIMCYSDYPVPKEFTLFMPNKLVLKYLNMYAEKFNLRKYIQFKKKVVRVKKSEDFRTSGTWSVTIRDVSTGNMEDHEFDAVMLCTGHHADKNIPDFEGLKNFQGTLVHTHDYRKPQGYEDKRIVVIGIGNSGLDSAVELSRVASQVFLSTRRGAWVFTRAECYELANTSRAIRTVFKWININKYLIRKINERFDHARFSLQPNHLPLSAAITINNDLSSAILSGSIKVKPNVKKFTKTGIEFEDETFEDNIDVVVFATGYRIGFPFLDKSVIDVENNGVELYKSMFLPDLEKNTLAFIGLVQPTGAFIPIFEQQCRLFTRVVKGDVMLPTKEAMWKDVRTQQNNIRKRYTDSPRNIIMVDYLGYMDELAKLTGNYPHLGKLLLKDPRLAFSIFFGPLTPQQYRVIGPGQWQGAREEILYTHKMYERNYNSLCIKPVGFSKKFNPRRILLKICFYLFILIVLVHYFSLLLY